MATNGVPGVNAAVPSPRGATGRRSLDRDLILRTALDMLDTHGPGELTMRKLGTRLGVDPMALYHHVPGRDVLLDGVAELILAELRFDPADAPTGMPWQEYVQRLAHGMRSVALEHPKVFPLIATRPPEAPWLRPPMRSVWLVEMFLATLVENGFTPEAAVTAYRSFSSFLLGHLLLEASARGADIARLDQPEPDADGSIDPEQYPLIVGLRSQLATEQSDAEFEQPLEELLERFEAMRRHPRSTS